MARWTVDEPMYVFMHAPRVDIEDVYLMTRIVTIYLDEDESTQFILVSSV
jgi:hypothetical protein